MFALSIERVLSRSNEILFECWLLIWPVKLKNLSIKALVAGKPSSLHAKLNRFGILVLYFSQNFFVDSKVVSLIILINTFTLTLSNLPWFFSDKSSEILPFVIFRKPNRLSVCFKPVWDSFFSILSILLLFSSLSDSFSSSFKLYLANISCYLILFESI